MLKAGRHLTTIRTLVLVAMAHAAPRWTSGRPTPFPRPTHPTLARPPAKQDVTATPVVVPIPRPDMQAPVTPMDAISTPTVKVTSPSMGLA